MNSHKYSSNFYLFFIILMLCFIQVQNTEFKKFLRPSQTFCFTEDLPRHTLYEFSGSAAYHPFRVQIMQLRTLIANKTVTSQKTFSYKETTQNFGRFRYCITNLYTEHQMVSFKYVYGTRANDFGSHSESSDYIRSLENQARIAEMFSNKQALEMMSKSGNYGGEYSLQYYFTTVFVGIIVFFTYAQYKTIKSHMRNRKYI